VKEIWDTGPPYASDASATTSKFLKHVSFEGSLRFEGVKTLNQKFYSLDFPIELRQFPLAIPESLFSTPRCSQLRVKRPNRSVFKLFAKPRRKSTKDPIMIASKFKENSQMSAWQIIDFRPTEGVCHSFRYSPGLASIRIRRVIFPKLFCCLIMLNQCISLSPQLLY